MEENFRFNPDDHGYYLGDRRIVSVTQALQSAGMLNYRFTNEEDMMRGTFVHQATEWIDRGTLDWDSLDPILLPYCRAYEKFIRDVRPEIVLSEKPMYHRQYFYAGKPDRVYLMNGFYSVVDVKSGANHPATKVQIAAYCELVRNTEGTQFLKGFSLHLRNDGTYRLDEIGDLKRHFNTFLAALSIARWREENL